MATAAVTGGYEPQLKPILGKEIVENLRFCQGEGVHDCFQDKADLQRLLMSQAMIYREYRSMIAAR